MFESHSFPLLYFHCSISYLHAYISSNTTQLSQKLTFTILLEESQACPNKHYIRYRRKNSDASYPN